MGFLLLVYLEFPSCLSVGLFRTCSWTCSLTSSICFHSHGAFPMHKSTLHLLANSSLRAPHQCLLTQCCSFGALGLTGGLMVAECILWKKLSGSSSLVKPSILLIKHWDLPWHSRQAIWCSSLWWPGMKKAEATCEPGVSYVYPTFHLGFTCVEQPYSTESSCSTRCSHGW